MINERFENAKELKDKLNQIKKLKSSLTELLKRIKFNDIKLEKRENHNSNTYSIIFPENIISTYNELTGIIEKETDDRKKKICFYEIYEDISFEYDGLSIRIQIYNEDSNRIHNPGSGLSQSFRNLGLGKKIFKRIIQEVGFITSEHRDTFGEIKNSIQSDLLWFSLYNDDQVICKTNGNLFFAYLKKGKSFEHECNQYLKS